MKQVIINADCILCGLCVRFCAEVKKKNAVGFVDCGARREIRFLPEIALTECIGCKECFALCPTSYIQAVSSITHGFLSSVLLLFRAVSSRI